MTTKQRKKENKKNIEELIDLSNETQEKEVVYKNNWFNKIFHRKKLAEQDLKQIEENQELESVFNILDDGVAPIANLSDDERIMKTFNDYYHLATIYKFPSYSNDLFLTNNIMSKLETSNVKKRTQNIRVIYDEEPFFMEFANDMLNESIENGTLTQEDVDNMKNSPDIPNHKRVNFDNFILNQNISFFEEQEEFND